MPHSVNPPLHIGCPVWASDLWKGTLFTKRVSRRGMLAQYSSVFNTVEGNSVFYGLPTDDTLKRWIENSAPGFRFALKFPRAISHEHQLRNASSETREFLNVVETLAEANRLGPSFLQLPPHFSPDQIDDLDRLLQSLPREFPYAVEVRHVQFYDQGDNEKRLTELLKSHGVSNVLLDSRPLFARPPADESERISQRRKPRTPLRSAAIGDNPVLRLIGRNDVTSLEVWAQSWSKIIARWVRDGFRPFVFTHTPNEAFAPFFGRLLHEKLSEQIAELTPLACFAGEEEAAKAQTQQRLF